MLHRLAVAARMIVDTVPLLVRIRQSDYQLVVNDARCWPCHPLCHYASDKYRRMDAVANDASHRPSIRSVASG